MNSNRYLVPNGSWSLFVTFALASVASGNTGTIPSALVHPFTWEIMSNGKRVAWGTAPLGDFYRFGIHERALVELLASTSGDCINFYDRRGNAITDRFDLMTGWTSQQPAALAVKLESLKKYATPEKAPRTVTRRKAAK